MAYEGERAAKVFFYFYFYHSKVHLRHSKILKKQNMDTKASYISFNGNFIFHLEILR